MNTALAPIEHRRPAPTTDTELATRAAAGDEVAFEAIMRRHNRQLFRAARSVLKVDADAEDALQEAYLRAWRALPAFRAESKLSTWLTRIVINEALGRLRQRRGDAALPHDDDDPEALEDTLADDAEQQPERLALRAEWRRLIQARIDALPDAFRSAFVLREVEELEVEDVAAALDLPPATVRTRCFRARALLREGLARDIDLALPGAFAFDGARCDRVVAGVLARLATQP